MVSGTIAGLLESISSGDVSAAGAVKSSQAASTPVSALQRAQKIIEIFQSYYYLLLISKL